MLIRLLAAYLCLTTLAFAQFNDRSEYRSGAFDRREAVVNKMKEALWQTRWISAQPDLKINQLGYNSNVLNDPDGEELDDYTASPQVGITAFAKLGQSVVMEAAGQYDYEYYHDNEFLRGDNYDLRLALHGLVELFYWNASFEVRDSQDRPNTEIDLRQRNEFQSLSGLGLWQWTRRTVLEFNLRRNKFDFNQDSGILTRLNRDEQLASLAYYFQYSERFWPFVEVSRNRSDFRNGLDSTITWVYVGARNPYAKRLHYSLRLGQFDFEQELNGVITDTTDDLAYLAFVKLGFTRRVVLELGATRQPIFSVLDQFSHFVSHRVSMAMVFRLSPRVSLVPNVFVGKNDYREVPGVANGDSDLKGIGLNIDLPKWLHCSYGLKSGWTEREGEGELRGYNGYYVQGVVKYEF